VSTIYLVRHGKAGNRDKWEAPDHLRPITKRGRRQAASLVDLLGDAPITRVLSSPYVRCRQTMEPLAARLGLPVETVDALAEGASLDDSLALVEKLAGETAALCTHGDVMGNLLAQLERQGVRIGEPLMQMGGVWVLDTEAGSVISARYEPPTE
jgi:phosphohistidine phosphatase SixA